MSPQVPTVVAAGAVACLAVGAGLSWMVAGAWLRSRLAAISAPLATALRRLSLTTAAAEVFDYALIAIDDGRPTLIAGQAALNDCAAVLGAAPTAAGVIDVLAAIDPDYARRLEVLFTAGAACAFEVEGPQGEVLAEGRSAGAMAWLRLSVAAAPRGAQPTGARLAAFIDAYPDPAWIAAADGAPAWVNRAWLAAVEAGSLADALARGLTLDPGADALVRNAAARGQGAERVRWASLAHRRRALQVRVEPLEGGGVGVWTSDVTQVEAAAENLRRHGAAHDLTLGHIGDAVAVFGPDRRLAFHNTAFARLWDLEPAWLAGQPSHAEILDRLRQRRRLPETVDYSRFKAEELARYEQVQDSAEAIWRLPGERTLRVVGQPHPLGGLIMVFSDITPELRLKTQFNHLIEVQRATLDKLTDAVAVFGADAQLKLHNEAFQRFWNLTAGQLANGPDFDGVAELCTPRLHDLQFWRDIRGRITDPDPRARAPVQGEVATADGRFVAWQSRPLPDGATLLGFVDITDTRRLEGALRDREAALSDAERLKHEFVGSVSYELRTPLTTILGYSELLERSGEGLGERARGYVAAVRSAAGRLARSINNVLDIAQIDAAEMVLEINDVDVAQLLAAAAARWEDEALAAKVAIGIAQEPAPGMIRGDPARLAQVLDHLTENALRHTPEGGAVTLSAARALGEVRLQVSDTGRGIPFHVQAHIFDRFSGQERGGPGLGLALVKALVELHGGWVAVESEPGAGAAFTCHLPEAAQSPPERPELL